MCMSKGVKCLVCQFVSLLFVCLFAYHFWPVQVFYRPFQDLVYSMKMDPVEKASVSLPSIQKGSSRNSEKPVLSSLGC